MCQVNFPRRRLLTSQILLCHTSVPNILPLSMGKVVRFVGKGSIRWAGVKLVDARLSMLRSTTTTARAVVEEREAVASKVVQEGQGVDGAVKAALQKQGMPTWTALRAGG